MAERPKPSLKRLKRAGAASQDAIIERIAPYSLNAADVARRYGDSPGLVGRPVPQPLEGARTPIDQIYRDYGAGFGTIDIADIQRARQADNIPAERQKYVGAGSTASDAQYTEYALELRRRALSGEIGPVVREDGTIYSYFAPMPDLVGPDRRASLAGDQQDDVETDGMYPVPGLNAGEFRTTEDADSEYVARQGARSTVGITRAWERARAEAELQRLGVGFQPTRTAFSGDWNDEDARVQWLFQNYPSVAVAAREEGLSDSEVSSITNLAMARDVAVEILNEPLVARRRQMIAAMPPTQGALVESIILDLAEDRKRDEAYRRAQGNDPNIAGTVMSIFWGSMGPGASEDEETGSVSNRPLSPAWVMDVLYDISEFGQHVGRAVSLEFGERDALGKLAYGLQTVTTLGGNSLITAAQRWGDTDHGTWNAAGLAEAELKYGAEKTQLIVDILDARAEGSTEAFWAALERVEGRPEEMAIFMEAMQGIDADPQVTEMVQFIAAQSNSNLGVITARGAGLEPGSLPFDATRDVTNVVGFFALDPLLMLGVAGKAVQGARYGLYALMKADEGAEVGKYLSASIKGSEAGGVRGRFQDWWKGTANVRRYLDWYGGELERIRGLEGLERANATTTLLSQSKRYFSVDAYETLLKAGVKDADTFYDWLQGADDITRIFRGQGAKRAKDMAIPHLSRTMRVAKDVSAQVRGIDPTRRIAERAERELAVVLGDDFARLTADEQDKALLAVLQDEEKTRVVAEALSDLQGTQSRLGKIVSKRAKGISFDQTGTVSWRRRYGWKRKKSESLFDFFQRWSDRASRAFAKFPTAQTVYIDDARDAEVVYEMMRGAGIPRYWASYFRQQWIEMQPGERRIAMAGLVRTYGYASGAHLVDKTAMRYLDEIVTGIRSSDSYAAPMATELPMQAAKAQQTVDDAIARGRQAAGENYTYVDKDGQEILTRGGSSGYVSATARTSDETPFPGNWDSDPDPFPVAHMTPKGTIRNAHRNYLKGKDWEEDLPPVDYDSVRVNPERMREIADEYDALPMYDEAAIPAFDAMLDETLLQYDYMTKTLGIRVVVVDEDPYESIAAMVDDVVNNKTIKVLSTSKTGGHPIFTDADNDKFRAVHDFFGHAATGRGFDRHGEEAAWLAHSRMYSPLARRAMTTETRGQNSFLNTRGEFGPQKVALIPQRFVDEAETIAYASVRNEVPVSARVGLGNMSQRQARKAARQENIDTPPVVVDPSRRNGISSGVFYGQTADRVAIPNFGAIDALRARSSWMGSLLMRNRVGTSVTDWWTLLTLAGPRFAVRNGVEDIAFYGLTSGGLRNLWRGRQASTAIRESSERPSKWVQDANFRLQEAEVNLERAKRLNDKDRILAAQEEVSAASERAIEARILESGFGEKLGIVKTSMRAVGDKIPFMRALILPHLAREEVSVAAKAAAAGDREPLQQLVAKAFLRQKLVFLKGEKAQRLSRMLKDNVSLDDLPADLRQVVSDLDDFVASSMALEAMREASEAARHLVDGTLSQYSDNASVRVVNGQVISRRLDNVRYEGERVAFRGTPEQVRGLLAQLHFALHTDGPKSQRAMQLLPDYFEAYALARPAERRRMINELADFIDNNNSKVFDYKNRFSLSSQDDVSALAESTMDSLVAIFTKSDGKFNRELYDALKAPEEFPGVPRFKVHYEVDGQRIDNVTMEQFAKGEVPMPAYITVQRGDGIWMPEGQGLLNFRDEAWEMMGRSLARMTREPIYIGNYLEAREVLRPLEARLIKMGTDPAEARKQIVELAVDRAYMTTMSYVDNPMVRSRLAWSLRNVARFYRAQEDFIRRMWRTGENYPMAFWKAALAWEAAQNVGFIHEDQYGEAYFVYPGSRAVMESLSRGLFMLTGMPYEQVSVPMNLTGKLQWITPSADPDSWTPTLSSPWAGFGVRGLLRAMPMFNRSLEDITKSIEREAFGTIGENQGWINTWVPPNVLKAFNVMQTFLGASADGNKVLVSSLAGAATRKSMLALAAGGHIPTDGTEDPDTMRTFRRMADLAATNALVVLAVSGTILPASPQLSVDDVSLFARELGVQGLRPAFLEMVRKYGWDTAYMRWTAANPELAVFTVSESDRGNIGYYETTTEALQFVKSNLDLMKSSPNGLSYFSPLNGEESLAAYNYLMSQGLASKVDPGLYLYRLAEAQGDAERFLARQQRDQAMAKATTKERVDAIDKVYRRTLAEINNKYGDSSKDEAAFGTSDDARKEWRAIVRVADVLAKRGDKLAQWVLEVDPQYQDRITRLERHPQMLSGDANKDRDLMREGWRRWLIDQMATYQGDEQRERLLRIATQALFGTGGNWPWTAGFGIGEEG